MRKQIRLLLMLALPMLLGLASCAEHDNPVDPNPLAKQVSGLWWNIIDQEGTFSDATDSYPYTRLGQAICFKEDGTGYGITFFFNNDNSDPIAIIGGEDMAPFTYTSTADGRLTLDFSNAYHEYADYFKKWTMTYADGTVSATDGKLTLTLEKPSEQMAETIRDWDQQFNGGATADNYNINDEDFTPDNWREQESIYIYDGTGTDVTDAKGRTGYTLVNMPWYKGDKLTNLPDGFCNDITPANGWEWVLNRCGSRSIMNNNFFAVYNKYSGILRFFYYLPYGYNTGNDHVWQVSMSDHLANNSVWQYGLPLDRNISNKAALGQNGSGTYMEYVTPWVDYMSQDGLIVPNAGWWAFDVDLSMARADGILPSDNIKLQMRSWNTQHVSLASTVAAKIDGTFKGQFDITKTTVSSAKGLTQSLSDIAGVGKSLYSAVSSAIKGNYLDVLGNAVSFGTGAYNVYGAMTKKTTTSVDTLGKGSITGTINLGLTGTIDTEGTIRGSAPTVGIASPTFYLKDFDLKNSHLGQGVWNLKTPPVVYVLKRPYNTYFSRSACPYFFDPNSIEIQLNPDAFPESQVEWIKVEALCTAKTSKFNDDATRLAYGLGSYDAKGIYQSEPRMEVYKDWIRNLENLEDGYNNVFNDFLYSSEDKMGFDLKREYCDGPLLLGRCKDDLWLEPGELIYGGGLRLPFLEVNVTVRVKMKGMDTPILLSRNYLPEYKKWDKVEFFNAIKKAGSYKHTELYSYQMKRINDIQDFFGIDRTNPDGDKIGTAANATTADVGKVIGADGNLYKDVAAAKAAKTTAKAMIAYVGLTSGLAFALEDASTACDWYVTTPAVISWVNNNNAVSGAKWRVPSVDDYNKMFQACGGSGGLRNKLKALGSDYDVLDNKFYWTSTERIGYNEDNPRYAFRWRPREGDNTFNDYSLKENAFRIRACLEFPRPIQIAPGY